MNTKPHPIAVAFAIVGAAAHLIAGHVVYVKANIYTPLRTAAADVALLATGFAALLSQVKDLIV
ncbi:hypothetical protein LJR039_007584 [Pseudorhodoferax sp. LjRoot39]|uniref:hypothetical protein n=1 Tax=Pseudorhodoferax sp. LjRoot39 TaxID=3342328 RepID=UPI003ECFFF50